MRDEPITVTHRTKSVRKHFIDITIPNAPPEDEEGFVLRIKQGNAVLGEVELRPGDLAQFLRCGGDALSKVSSGVLWPPAGTGG